MSTQVRGKIIIIRCAKCGARLFDIIGDLDQLRKETPKRLKCYSCNAMNIIRVNDGHIRVDLE